MIKFSEFLKEAQATARVGIQHLEKMRPIDFIKLLTKINAQHGGILSKQSLDITEKVDGSSLRFGQSAAGKTFIESSYSGPIFDDGGYSKYVQTRGHSPSKMSQGFDNILSEIKRDRKLQSILSKYNKNGIKIICELLYIPFGVEEADKVKFIKIAYDKKNLGTEWTIIPFSIVQDDNSKHPNESEILAELYRISSADRKYVKPTVNLKTDIDISLEIKDIKSKILDKYDNLEQLLVSRKKVDKELKDNLKAEIESYQKRVSQIIMDHIESGAFGNAIEGVVVKMDDGTTLKVVSQEFKTSTYDEKRVFQ